MVSRLLDVRRCGWMGRDVDYFVVDGYTGHDPIQIARIMAAKGITMVSAMIISYIYISSVQPI
jgi:hypothetical protein